jgi:hypothetical protein
LHPERIGQSQGRIDWRIAALDTAGLLLFFVPGVIAFAVDFYNGTIFLPPVDSPVGEQGDPELLGVDVPGDRVDRQGIEAVLSKHIGQPLRLIPGTFRTKRLDKIDAFWAEVKQLSAVHAMNDEA